MRVLDPEFEKKFENELHPIIDFVKNNEDVFLGIRNNYIDLYVDGGCFFELTYSKRNKTIKGKIDTKYFNDCPQKMPKSLNAINNKPLNSIDCWMKILYDLKDIVSNFQKGNISKSKKTKREKILQQKLIHEFNNDSKYFAYDMEYVIEGLRDYVLDAKKLPKKDKNNPEQIKTPKQLGRTDIILINKPSNNKIKVYFMEVKEGTDAFSGVLPNNSNDESAPSFGSGIEKFTNQSLSMTKIAKKIKKKNINSIYDKIY